MDAVHAEVICNFVMSVHGSSWHEVHGHHDFAMTNLVKFLHDTRHGTNYKVMYFMAQLENTAENMPASCKSVHVICFS